MSRLRFGPPPAIPLELTPTASEVEFFRDNGYLVVERLTTDEELAWLRRIFEFIFDPQQAHKAGAPIDLSGADDSAAAHSLSQAFFPEMRFPELLDTNHRRNARRYAAALLGVDVNSLTSWSHMIRKLPGGRAALWHQDRAYWQPELDYRALGSWLPLHDVSIAMGAMQFIPGSHKRGLLPHRHADAPQHNNLEVDAPFDASAAVACPLRAGGATFHHAHTLHFTAPNSTEQARLAFPMEFETAPVRRRQSVPMPWVDERRAVVGSTPVGYVADGKFIAL
jgi:ectoine hydroxylase-related dioxygenase (phytanoyl-CoA dioxygenase family)